MDNKSKKGILLEAGTNEVEIIEFIISGQHFGINVSKVVNLLQYTPVTTMPNSNPFVEGVFKPRDEIITLINLAAYLGLSPSEDAKKDIYIITNFNKNRSAFHVHTVEAIHRIGWERIEKPDSTIYGGEEGLVTGIARINDKLVTIIDFEKILADISPQTGIQMADLDQLGVRTQIAKPILIAEDSPLLEKMIMEALSKSGYNNVICCTNGREAWDRLKEIKETGDPITRYVTCVITDIEMPQMDGHKLCKLIKEDPDLRILPVIIFSSLINDEMRDKGMSIGATAQISKPEIVKLVSLIDKYAL
ncbi:chemotaxis protein CheV [Clostridia bacterium]|nr:chemotaxis protein CheV [Clostridia bacterium]